MKVLWITNKVFPAQSKALGRSDNARGGWIYSLALQLIQMQKIQLAIASVYPGHEKRIDVIDNVKYYLVPTRSMKSYQKELEDQWKEIYQDFQPDIVHIHGTEYAPGLSFLRTIQGVKCVISIQGLVSVYERYYYAGLDISTILRNLTIKDILSRNSIIQGRYDFKKRGLLEKEYIQLTHHVIGRTNWDFVHAKSINPSVQYHFCNENLRKEFYKTNWKMDNIRRHSVFLSQGSAPLKGLHMAIKALRIVKEEFEDVVLNVAGSDISISKYSIIKAGLKGYGKYIKRLVKKLSLESNICYKGNLDAEQMADQYRHSHVFVCPSSIENSPNSLGEAQLVGTPCIASYVGGIPDMVEDKQSALLYRFEEYESLAHRIIQIFRDDELAERLSKRGKVEAERRHNWHTNGNRMLEIYTNVIDE